LGGAFVSYGSPPTTYFLINRFLEFSNQLPKRVLGLTTNPLRVNTDGGCRIMSTQVLQMFAEFPRINFGTSFRLRSQKAQPADDASVTGKSELFSMQSKQIKAPNSPGKKLPASPSTLPQKLHFGV
jgi:hypothetical protein